MPGASYTMRPLRPMVVSPVYRPRPTPYSANKVLSRASNLWPGSDSPSSDTASPFSKPTFTLNGLDGHSDGGLHQARAPSPGTCHWSISPPDNVTPSRLSLMV